MVVHEVLKIICKKENQQVTDSMIQNIFQVGQPCRFETFKHGNKIVIMDVCHNIDGYTAVFNQILVQYPSVKKVKVIFGMAKGKDSDKII